jgi:hypothetical protein
MVRQCCEKRHGICDLLTVCWLRHHSPLRKGSSAASMRAFWSRRTLCPAPCAPTAKQHCAVCQLFGPRLVERGGSQLARARARCRGAGGAQRWVVQKIENKKIKRGGGLGSADFVVRDSAFSWLRRIKMTVDRTPIGRHYHVPRHYPRPPVRSALPSPLFEFGKKSG